MPPIRSERKELSPCGGSINPVQHTVRKPKLFRNEKSSETSSGGVADSDALSSSALCRDTMRDANPAEL